MRFKKGVVLWNMDPLLEEAMGRIDEVHRQAVGRDAIVTSARDGEHSVADSRHYVGRALDLRTRDLTLDQQHELVAALQRELGTAWDCVLEPSHIHLELDS